MTSVAKYNRKIIILEVQEIDEDGHKVLKNVKSQKNALRNEITCIRRSSYVVYSKSCIVT